MSARAWFWLSVVVVVCVASLMLVPASGLEPGFRPMTRITVIHEDPPLWFTIPLGLLAIALMLLLVVAFGLLVRDVWRDR